jgi:hypothetical protein
VEQEEAEEEEEEEEEEEVGVEEVEGVEPTTSLKIEPFFRSPL